MKYQRLPIVLPGLRRFSTKLLFDSHPICSPSVMPSFTWPCDIDNLRKSLKLRSMKEKQLSQVQRLHSECMQLQSVIDDLSLSKERNSLLLKSDLKNVTLREEGKTIRLKISSLKKEWKIKHADFLSSYLELPNIVDENHAGVKVSLPFQHTIEHSEPSDLMNYIYSSEHGCRYLLGAIAMWERELLDLSFDYVQKYFGFIPLQLSDFVRAPVVAASDNVAIRPSIEATKEEIVEIEGSDPFVNPFLLYHLVGSASLEAILAFLMRNSFKKKTIPLRITALGRDYSIKDDNIGPQRITQRNLVSYAVVTSCYSEASNAFNEMLQQVITFWESLSLPFTVEVKSVSPSQLRQYETARLEVLADGRIPLAHLSLIGDFLSRRLMIRASDGRHLFLIQGALINTFDLLDSLVSSNCSLNDLVEMKKRLENIL